MLNIGVIGCGKIAQVRHIPEYAANKNCKLSGFFSPNAKRAEDMAAKYGGKVYSNVDAILAEPDIDAVSVCAANYAHAELSIKALEAGKHVLCEKPMATTLDQCEAMLKAAKKSGKRLMIAHNQRFIPAHVYAKKLLEQGEIGRVISFRSTLGHGGPEKWSISPGKDTWFFNKEFATMGVMADLGIHKTDLLRFLMDKDIVSATSRLCTLDKRGADGQPIPVDDNAFCIYEMSGGIFGTVTASWSHYGYMDDSTVLYGSDGIMRLNEDPNHPVLVIKPDGSRKVYGLQYVQDGGKRRSSGVIDEFISAIEENRSSALDAAGIINSMKAVFASVQSAEEGRTVTIE